MADPFPVSGNIDPKAFPFLLGNLHRRAATGSLKVEGPSFRKALYFRTGRILFGSSDDPGDQLGEILIEQGKIQREQLDDVNAKVGPGNPLAKVLAESGYVNQRELGEAARIKVERILSDVIGYATGSFEFEDGVLPKGAVDLKLSTEKLMLSAVKRLGDRSFVLRHLESLTVVLAPTDALASRLEELRSESADLPDRLDGRRSLKEAAGLTHLDDFAAAKVACALLFLGLVRRLEPGEGPVAGVAAGEEIDFSRTAGMVFAEPSIDATVALPRPAPGREAEPPFFTELAAPPDSAALHGSASEPLSFPSLSDTAFPITPPSPPDFPTPQTEAFSPPPPPPAQPSPAPPRPGAATIPGVPLAPPASAPVHPPTATGTVPSLAEPPPTVASRPSKEDLAALDALLNPGAARGPLQPLAPAKGERWEPQFRAPAPQPRRPSRKRRLSSLLLFGVVGLAALGLAAGAWYYFMILQPASARAGQAPRGAVPTPAPSPAAASPAPTPLAMASPATTPVPPTPAAAPRATPPVTPPPVTPATGGAAKGRDLLQKGSFSQAAVAFAVNLKAARGFSVQVLVACSTDTIQKAVQAVPGEELYILPVNFRGRSCYRLCWGVYDSEARAGAALQSLPEYFRQGGATPKVQPISDLLP